MKNRDLANIDIHIGGPHRMHNELIAYYLERVMGAECTVKHDIGDSLYPDGAADENTRLVLCDYDGIDMNRLMAELGTFKTFTGRVTFFALFNIPSFTGLEQLWLKRGVHGLFYRNDPMSRLLTGVKHICGGGIWVPMEYMTRIILRNEAGKELLSSTNLTPRQIEVLSLLAGGASNKEISDKLCISTNTVRTHLHGIFQAINVSSRHQAAKWVTKNFPQELLSSIT